MLLAAFLFINIVAFLFAYALCKAAGEADEKEIQWIEQRKKEEKKFYYSKWCDDECIRCPENDWCKFSEVNHSGKQ